VSFPSVLEVVWHERELLSDMVELAYTSPVAEPVAASRTSCLLLRTWFSNKRKFQYAECGKC